MEAWIRPLAVPEISLERRLRHAAVSDKVYLSAVLWRPVLLPETGGSSFLFPYSLWKY
jgi:hypothetical protein